MAYSTVNLNNIYGYVDVYIFNSSEIFPGPRTVEVDLAISHKSLHCNKVNILTLKHPLTQNLGSKSRLCSYTS